MSFWEEQLKEMIHKHGDQEEWKWKILHLMSLKYGFDQSIIGRPAYIFAKDFYDKMDKRLDIRDREWLKIAFKGL